MIRSSSCRLLHALPTRRWNNQVGTLSVPLLRTTSHPSLFLNSNHNSYPFHPNSIGFHGRSYISRAHPRPPREFAVPDAIARILQDITRRQKKRVKRMEYFLKRKPLIVQKYAKSKSSTTVSSANTTKTTDADANKASDKASSSSDATKASPPVPFDPANIQHPVETFEMAIMLNLDPRKPGQSLRGSITLPHGTGKKGRNVLVLTHDEDLAAQARAAGAFHAGGEAVIDQLVAGTIAIDSVAAILALADIMPTVTKKAARLLGPRGLMPNAKVGTIHTQGPALLEALQSAVAGKEVTFRTEKEGIVHVPVGNHSFTVDQLLDNIGTVMKAILEAKPDSYGKGKKKQAKKGQALSAKSQPKYLLRVVMSSTQSKGFRVDLRTLDPNSAFFLSTLDPLATRRDDVVAEAPPTTTDDAAGRTMSASQ